MKRISILLALLMVTSFAYGGQLASKLKIDTVNVQSSTTFPNRYFVAYVDTVGNHTDTLAFPTALRYIEIINDGANNTDTVKVSYSVTGKTEGFADFILKGEKVNRDFAQALVRRVVVKANANNIRVRIKGW